MFEISYYGGNAIEIATKDVTLVFDGNRSSFGKKNLSAKDGAEFATEDRFLTNDPAFRVSLCGAGEYEVSNIMVQGVAASRHLDDPKAEKDSTVFSIRIGDQCIALLGNILGPLNDDQLEVLGMVDILIIPVGGNGYTLDAADAAKIISQITPKIVIPIHYAENGYNYEVPQDSFNEFKEQIKAEVIEDKTLKFKPNTTMPASLTIYKLTAQ
ncbi:MBL fold metallo-hydrolase [Candidatus Saccharibacteria bacterium]|nr:MBL fold metallo-hydrolase [Candidatus Saccharibacteria bacterium]